jgi:hypothetical protein
MNRKLKTGLKILFSLVSAAVECLTGRIVSYVLAEREPRVDYCLCGGGSGETLFEWHDPVTNGAPGPVVVCSWEYRAAIQCYRIRGTRIEAYHMSEQSGLKQAISDVEDQLWNQGEAINTNAGYVAFTHRWVGMLPSGFTSSVVTVSYPLDRQPAAIRDVRSAVDACLTDASTAEFHHSYLRLHAVAAPGGGDVLVRMDDLGWSIRKRSRFKQRDVLWWYGRRTAFLVPVDKGVDPFRCIGRDYRPGSAVTLIYSVESQQGQEDSYLRAEVYAGNAVTGDGTRNRKDSENE